MLTSVCQILQNRTLCCSAIHVFCSLLAVLRQIVGDPKNNEMRRAQFSRASYMMLLVTRNATNRRNSAILQHFGYYVFKNKQPIGTMILIHYKMNNI